MWTAREIPRGPGWGDKFLSTQEKVTRRFPGKERLPTAATCPGSTQRWRDEPDSEELFFEVSEDLRATGLAPMTPGLP